MRDKTMIVVDDMLPLSLPIISLRDRPYFPHSVNELMISGSEQVAFVEGIADSSSAYLGFILMKEIEDIVADDPHSYLYSVGSVARIVQFNKVENEARAHIFVKVLERFEIEKFVADENILKAKVHYLSHPSIENSLSHGQALKEAVAKLSMINPLVDQEIERMILMEDPFVLANYAATLTSASGVELQELLSAQDGSDQIEKAISLIQKEIEIGNTKKRIIERIEEQVSRQQKEFFLRQQLKEISKELGLSANEKEIEIRKFEKLLGEKSISEIARKRVLEELEKIRLLDSGNSEYSVSRNYLEWVLALPWNEYTQDNLDLAAVKEVLNQEHYGQDQVKERVLEFISVAKARGEVSGSILLLVGPPGVGKTSIGKSMAKCLGRKFYRLSVGGMRDEAEIKGHRRTYISALPGKFIQALKNLQSCNPVVMLDEIDKIGSSFNGDPASALLEVLDPEQNKMFSDFYLDLPFDLSKILFICTANQIDSIPRALLDRMEIIMMSGYIESEKVSIGQQFLIPRITKDFGLGEDMVHFAPGCLEEIIDGYAREAGMRSFEKKLQQILRKITMQLDGKKRQITVGIEDLSLYLGHKSFREEETYGAKLPPGVAIGMAYTPQGGATLNIEASKVISRGGGFKQTGHLGSVMVESAQIAYSYIRSFFGASQRSFFEEYLIHLHIPAGATPKDGPSAGLTMAMVLYSLTTGLILPRDLAMSGELTLKGRVMPVGGLKEKTLAAKRARIKRLILPSHNREDFNSLAPSIRENISVVFVEDFKEALESCFGKVREVA